MNKDENLKIFFENLLLLIIKNKSLDVESYNKLIAYFESQKVDSFRAFKLNLENLNLNYSQINKRNELIQIPDLYELKSIEDILEYQQVMEILFIAIEKLKKDISKYVLDILKSNLSEENINVRFSSMYLLLFYLYKIKHKEDKKAFEDKYNLEKFLDNNQTKMLNSDRSLDDIEILVFNNLKYFLNNENDNFQSKSHKLCHYLGISLSLTKMIDFSVKSVDKNVENLFMLIGPTGHGKTTLINYLYGVEYVKSYLRLYPKTGHSNRLKVGDGSRSETLYCETLNISKNDDIQINLCDSPGFFEIFSDDKAIISSLGVPLIVQNAKNIRAIIICLEFDSLNFSTGNKGHLFRIVTSSLMLLFKNFKENFNQVKLLFAITKCHAENSMDMNLEVIKNELILFDDRREDYKEEIQKNSEKFTNISEEKKVYEHYLNILDDIINDKTSTNEGLIKGLISIVKYKFKKNQDVNLDNLGNTLENKIKDLQDKWDSRLAEEYKKNWLKELESLEEKLKKLDKAIKNRVSEIDMVDMLLKNCDDDVVNNMFFFRCDNKDDKEKFLKKLSDIANTNEAINKEIFNFSNNQRIFDKVNEWCSEKLVSLIKKLNNIEEVLKNKNQNERNISILDNEIKNKEEDLNTNLQLIIVSLETNQLTEEDFKLISIEYAKLEKSKILMKHLQNSIQAKNDLVKKINEGVSLHDTKDWKRSIFDIWMRKLLGRKSDFRYDYPFNDKKGFFGKSSKSISKVPIEQVLLHCLNENKEVTEKIVITNSDHATTFEVEAGIFQIEKSDFEKGIFSITFSSNENFNGSIKLQFLTKSINIASNLEKIDKIKESIKNDENDLEKENNNYIQSNKNYEFEKNIIKLKSQGRLDSIERSKIISERLRSLNYTEEKFLTKLITNLKLKTRENNLKSIFDFVLLDKISRLKTINRNENQLENMGITDRTLNLYSGNLKDKIIYLEDEEILILKEIFDQSGLTFSSIKSILDGLKNNNNLISSNVELPLYTKMKNLENERDQLEKKLKNLISIYEQDNKVVEILDQISKILDLNSDSNFKNFSLLKSNLEKKFTKKINEEINFLQDRIILILKEIFDQSGLTFSSIKSILDGLKNDNNLISSNVELPLYTKMRNLENERDQLENKLNNLRSIYEQQNKVVEILDQATLEINNNKILDQISKILDLNNDSNLKNNLDKKLKEEINLLQDRRNNIIKEDQRQFQQVNFENEIKNKIQPENKLTCDFFFRQLSEFFTDDLNKAELKKYTDSCIDLLENSNNNVYLFNRNFRLKIILFDKTNIFRNKIN